MGRTDPAAVAARMDRIPNTSWSWMVVLLVSGALIVEALDIGTLGTILPVVRKVMVLTASDTGLLAASSAPGIVIGMIPAGHLAPGRRFPESCSMEFSANSSAAS